MLAGVYLAARGLMKETRMTWPVLRGALMKQVSIIGMGCLLAVEVGGQKQVSRQESCGRTGARTGLLQRPACSKVHEQKQPRSVACEPVSVLAESDRALHACRCGEMADAQDLKSWGRKKPCGFESHHRHQHQFRPIESAVCTIWVFVACPFA